MENTRNYDDPAYKEFRKQVLRRDNYFCQWPNCGSTRNLCVHHIRTWADHPNLRFNVSNGITLCKNCHNRIWSLEESFERLFNQIVKNNINKRPKNAHKPNTSRRRSKNKSIAGNAQENSEQKKIRRYLNARKKYRRRLRG